MILKLYRVDEKYLTHLRNTEKKIPLLKGNYPRPFVGVVLVINGLEYVAPLSSQPKGTPSDFKVIHQGKQIATVRFGYMFPIVETSLVEIDFVEEDKNDAKYAALLRTEIANINHHKEDILELAQKTYQYCKDKKDNFHIYCCDFLTLEELARNYVV